jgi:signal transduction protein with GAF and PtsI domain
MMVLARPDAMAEIHLTGRAASPGLAIGPVAMLTTAVAKRTNVGDPAQETAALQAAIEAATAEIAGLIESVQGEVADILEFQVAMIEDDALAEGAYHAIAAGTAADQAWRAALDAEIAGYRAAEDEYFRARAVDLVDIRDRVLAHLGGADKVAKIACGSIVAGEDITPSAFLAADWTRGGGIVLAAGSPSSHVAMLAYARRPQGRRTRPVFMERPEAGLGAGRWRRRHRDLRSRTRNTPHVRAPNGGRERCAGRGRGRPRRTRAHGWRPSNLGSSQCRCSPRA